MASPNNPPKIPLTMRYLTQNNNSARTPLYAQERLLSRRERREIQVKAEKLARKRMKTCSH